LQRRRKTAPCAGIREFARLASIQDLECWEWTDKGIKTNISRIAEMKLPPFESES
jgi:hypothetical protein